jgi:hypothetical protein
VNEILVKWSEIYTKGITLSTSTKILLFAKDEVIIADSEDNLQRGVFVITKHSQKFWNGDITGKCETIALVRGLLQKVMHHIFFSRKLFIQNV